MCDPLTLAISATALAAISGGVGTIGKIQQSNYQARIADRDAKLASAQAADAYDRGKLDIQKLQMRNSQDQGRQRAALAANGIEVDFGSAGQMQQDTMDLGRDEVAITNRNTQREAEGFDISASNYTASAKAARHNAVMEGITGALDLGSTILGGVKQVGGIKASQKAGGSGFDVWK